MLYGLNLHRRPATYISIPCRDDLRSGQALTCGRRENLALKITRPELLSEVLLLNGSGIKFADAIDQVASINGLDAASKTALGDIVRLLTKDAGISLND